MKKSASLPLPNDNHLAVFWKRKTGKEMVNSTLVINLSSQDINVIWVKLVVVQPSIHGFTKHWELYKKLGKPVRKFSLARKWRTK